MNNAELITGLRNHRVCEDADGCKTCELMNAAADALEAAERLLDQTVEAAETVIAAERSEHEQCEKDG